MSRDCHCPMCIKGYNGACMVYPANFTSPSLTLPPVKETPMPLPPDERPYIAYISINTFLDTFATVAREHMVEHAGWELDDPQHPEDIAAMLSTVLDVTARTLGVPQVRTYPHSSS